MTARRLIAAAGAALALAGGALAAGCGDDDKSGARTAVQAPTTGAAPAATVKTNEGQIDVPVPTATTGEPKTSTGESGEGGAGDEEPARVPVTLTTAGAQITPSVVTIPAFLAIDVQIVARGGAEAVTIDAPGGKTVRVPAGGTAVQHLAGLKPGDYGVTTRSGATATLHVVSGGAPGP